MTSDAEKTAELSLFAVIRTRGPAWDQSLPIEGQTDWEAHRIFMNSLEHDGFVVLGGPLEGSSDALIIVRSSGPEEITGRFALDPWSISDHLRTSRIALWELRLGSLS